MRVRDKGQASLLAMAAVVVAAIATLIVAKVAVVAVDQARAQHAADAAALAGVTGGQPAAQQVAVANGAELIGFSTSAPLAGGAVRVTVTVQWADRTATATAEGG